MIERETGKGMMPRVWSVLLLVLFAVQANAAPGDSRNLNNVSGLDDGQRGMTAQSLTEDLVVGLYTNVNLVDSPREPVEFFHELGATLDFESGPFGLALDFSVLNDDRYSTSEPVTMLGYRFDLREGLVTLDFDPVHIKGGRTRHRDEVDTPYSMFISSYEDGYNPVILEFAYEGERFFYRTRWIEVNRESDLYGRRVPVEGANNNGDPQNIYPWDDIAERYGDGDEETGSGYTTKPFDRGANYMVMGVNLGDWRVGFQESVLYINEVFNPEYFLSPIPQYFTRLYGTKGAADPGVPWRQREDPNIHMGFFTDVTKPEWRAYFQFIMGDINLDFLTYEERTQPQKWAWSIGGERETQYGTFGLFHGGATRYIFAATSVDASRDLYSSQRYEYTYWPDVKFPHADGDRLIDYRENYIGYKYGENNVALMLTYENDFERFHLDSMAEMVVSGAKSPANPWHEYKQRPGRSDGRDANPPLHIFMLDEWPLEWTFRLGADVSRSFGPWTASIGGLVGGVFNELEYEAINTWDAPEPGRYVPGDTSRPLFGVNLGLRYSYEPRW